MAEQLTSERRTHLRLYIDNFSPKELRKAVLALLDALDAAEERARGWEDAAKSEGEAWRALKVRSLRDDETKEELRAENARLRERVAALTDAIRDVTIRGPGYCAQGCVDHAFEARLVDLRAARLAALEARDE